jgi:uncharacterized protein (DUF427 family)
MKAIWNDIVIAEAPQEELIYIEGNWYFPPTSIKPEYFTKSPTPYTCPWKGVCQFYTVGEGSMQDQDDAWTYPEPMPSAIERVKKDFSGYFAFWRSVSVVE